MSVAFEERGLDMPPWRQHATMVSRWESPLTRSYSIESVSGLADTSPASSSQRNCLLASYSSDASSQDMLGDFTLTPVELSRTSCLSFTKMNVEGSSVFSGAGLLTRSNQLQANFKAVAEDESTANAIAENMSR
eukprot:scaffold655507_cov42-Prasinocladus_malaysianus.AAC.1